MINIFCLYFTEKLFQLEEKKPAYAKRKLMSNAIVPAVFSLIKREVEESHEQGVKEKYVAAFK